MSIPLWQYAVSITVYTAVIFLFHEGARRFVKIVTALLIAAVITAPFWLQVEGWFRMAKTISVFVPLIFLCFVRIAHQQKNRKWAAFFTKQWVFWVLWVVVAVNILEAVLKDFSLHNYFNALSGIILILTMEIPGKSRWSCGKDSPNRDFLVQFPEAWTLLYTIWNITFVYGENPGYLAHSTCLLAVPCIYVMIGKSNLWLSARAYSLAFVLAIKGGFDFVTPLMETSHLKNEKSLFFWGVLNFALSTIYLGYFIYCKIKGRKSGKAEVTTG